MQKMGLLRNVLKSGHLIRVGHQNPRISSFLGESPRVFSTAQGTTPQNSPSPPNPILNNPNTGLNDVSGSMYGTVFGITRHTTKDDVLNLLDESDLTAEDLQTRYTPFFAPIGMLIQFPSMNAFNTAAKTLSRKGAGYRLTVTRPEVWGKSRVYDGKTLLLQDIPSNAVQEDIDRFISGCHQDVISTRQITRKVDNDNAPIKMVMVDFPSAILARNAFLTLDRKFCLNSRILAQVLY